MTWQGWLIVIGAPLLAGAAGGVLVGFVVTWRQLRQRPAALQAAYLAGWCKRDDLGAQRVPNMMFTADGQLVPEPPIDKDKCPVCKAGVTIWPLGVCASCAEDTAQLAPDDVASAGLWQLWTGEAASGQPPRPGRRGRRVWAVLDRSGQPTGQTVTTGPRQPADDSDDGLAWDGPGERGTALDPAARPPGRRRRGTS